MAANDNTATTDIGQQEERQQDNSRIAFADSPAPADPPQQKHQQEQCAANIWQALSGIAVQPRADKQTKEPKTVAKQQQLVNMELSQIELIYRAEGNANLVLALPQFKKVLRLPKTSLQTTSHISSSSNNTKHNKIQIGNNTQQQRDEEEVVDNDDEEWQQRQEHQQQQQQQQQQQSQQTQEWQLQRQQEQQKRQEVVQSASDPTVNQNAKDLTMEDFVAYIEVIRNLLGSEYVFETDIVRIAREEDKSWINEQIRGDRPAHRRDKEFCGEFGLLLPDATRLPIAFDILLSNLQAELIGDSYAIEIKPKQGWLLSPDVVNTLFDQQKPARAGAKAEKTKERGAAHNSYHVARCRFCAMQYLKLRAGKIRRRTSYCPMSLFSGDPARMLAAIDALLQCPQNNLRIFRNGILMYDGERYSYEDLVDRIFPGSVQIQLLKDLVVACLLRDYTANNSNNSTSSGKSSSSVNDDDAVDVVGIAKIVAGQPHLSASHQEQGALAKGGAARQMEESKVMSAHRTENTHTATQLTTAASTTTQETSLQAQITEVETLSLPKNCVLQKVLHLQLLAKRHMTALLAAGYANKSEKSYNTLKALLRRSSNQPLAVELESTEEYMLGATALDCSIMLAFQEISQCNQAPPHLQSSCLTNSLALSKHCVVMPCYDKTFLTKITLVDLDPKPDSHLCKYIKQTSQALDVFMDGGS